MTFARILAGAAGLAFAGTVAAQTAAPKPETKAEPKAKPTAKAAAKPVVGRDWAKIDTNKDGYISPEEMEVWLKANSGPDR